MPYEIAKFTKLEKLNVSYNHLERLPDIIFEKLKKLRYLNIRSNGFSINERHETVKKVEKLASLRKNQPCYMIEY